jgi:hypothetical protein
MPASYINRIERALDGSSALFLVLGMVLAVAFFSLGA